MVVQGHEGDPGVLPDAGVLRRATQPSRCKTAWHRQQLRVIYRIWRAQTSLDATLQGKGEVALEDLASQGRMGSSKWPTQRGEVVMEERWVELPRDLRDRQKAAIARVHEIRQQRKKQRVERAAGEAATKKKAQEERAAARQWASKNRKKTAGATPSR